jgi:hypothetical protein
MPARGGGGAGDAREEWRLAISPVTPPAWGAEYRCAPKSILRGARRELRSRLVTSHRHRDGVGPARVTDPCSPSTALNEPLSSNASSDGAGCRGLPGPRPALRARGRGQGSTPRSPPRWGPSGLREMGSPPSCSTAHRPVARLGEAAGMLYFGHAVRRGRVARRPAGGPGPSPAGGGGLDRLRYRRRARLRPSAGRRPPGHQAGEHPDLQWPPGRGRLRDRPGGGARRRGDAHRRRVPHRHGGLHEPGAGHRGLAGGRPERHLQPRLCALRDARRAPGVQRAQPQEHPHPAPHHRPTAVPSPSRM